jgi:hypothetical protein
LKVNDNEIDEEFFKSRYNKIFSKLKPESKINKTNNNNFMEKPNNKSRNKSNGKTKINEEDIKKPFNNEKNDSSKFLCFVLSKIQLKQKEKENNETNSISSTSSDESFTDKNLKLGFNNKIQTLLTQKDFGPKRIRLGLCCMNNYLRNQKKSIFCARSIILATYLSKGPQLAMDK